MQIIIEPVGNRFSGKLYIDEELVADVIDQRPGCCARSLMNQLLLKRGKPTSQIVVDISGWN
jgi:hypothetical protein